MKSTSKAFTLVELIVVITILAILATVGFLSLQGYTKDARNTATKSNMGTVVSAVNTESATSARSPVTYISTGSTDVTLTGAEVVGSGSANYPTGLTLVGLTASGAYKAGLVDYAALKLDPEKFKDGSNNFLAGALQYSEKDGIGKMRARPMFQIAGTIDEGNGAVAVVDGTFSSDSAKGDTKGIIYGLQANADGTTLNSASGGVIVGGGVYLPYAY